MKQVLGWGLALFSQVALARQGAAPAPVESSVRNCAGWSSPSVRPSRRAGAPLKAAGELDGLVRHALTDESLSQVSVTVSQLDTGRSWTVETNAEGQYHFFCLPPGHYTVRVGKPTYATVERDSIWVREKRVRVFDVKLYPADYTPPPPPLPPTSGGCDTVGATVNPDFIRNIRLHEDSAPPTPRLRGFTSLAELAPTPWMDSVGIGTRYAPSTRPSR